jgi:pyridinium-3,5-bisthiocarboxylic acid mononucleotide nickel chelatase
MELHLDLVGGLAGDMFIAAALDAFPQHERRVIQAIQAVTATSLVCTLHAHRDHVLQGRRFTVERGSRGFARAPLAGSHDTHAHTTWADIRARLNRSTLDPGTCGHALGIFRLLAQAEAFVHGVDVERVEFHEVGAWDSIADIVGAAALIDAVGATDWTYSPAPLGSGRVTTAHGLMPVPAPATARLLLDMNTIDDGIPGERITPTGAAILRYLCPPVSTTRPPAAARRLTATGTGFGTRVVAGISNHVRLLCFEPMDQAVGGQRLIHVLEFEVDDQSGEDLATGLERLRAHPAVLDVTQSVVFGKKGRMMSHVRVLARDSQWEHVIDACFRETTTIGLRHQTVHGVGLERRLEDICIDGHRMRVKLVDRPGGTTAKAESDDVVRHEHHARRAALRNRAERAVLSAARIDVDA